MNIKTAKNTRRGAFAPLPIRFDKLEAGSMFRIFAEPTRGINKSDDPTVYKKVCEAYSEDSGNHERAIILYPEDRVVPLTRPRKGGK